MKCGWLAEFTFRLVFITKMYTQEMKQNAMEFGWHADWGTID